MDSLVVRQLAAVDVDLFRSVRLAALRDSPDSFGETLDDAANSDWEKRVASLFQCNPPPDA
jgi:hypothetical protein